MDSKLYIGEVAHRRRSPVGHSFAYKLFMTYLDLDHTDEVFRGRWFWSSKYFNLAWFRRKDYWPGQHNLKNTILEQVNQASGLSPKGKVFLLCNLRYFGFSFNPVAFYFCFDESGSALEAIVAEVHNTPWGERHLYVLPCLSQQTGSPQGLASTAADEFKFESLHCFENDKSFHVSPFLPMDMQYRWRFHFIDSRLNIRIENFRKGSKVFDANLRLRSQPLNTTNMRQVLLSYPLVTLKVFLAIYFEALNLWLKGVPFYSHSKKQSTSERTSRSVETITSKNQKSEGIQNDTSK